MISQEEALALAAVRASEMPIALTELLHKTHTQNQVMLKPSTRNPVYETRTPKLTKGPIPSASYRSPPQDSRAGTGHALGHQTLNPKPGV